MMKPRDFFLQFSADGVPRPQGSKKAFLRGKKIVMKESAEGLKEWREHVASAAATHMQYRGLKCLEKTPMSVKLAFAMPRTKSMKPTDGLEMVQRPDIDKLERAILDALTGVAFKDDSQVCALHAVKRRCAPGEPPNVFIEVEPVKGPVIAW
jgi:gp69